MRSLYAGLALLGIIGCAFAQVGPLGTMAVPFPQSSSACSYVAPTSTFLAQGLTNSATPASPLANAIKAGYVSVFYIGIHSTIASLSVTGVSDGANTYVQAGTDTVGAPFRLTHSLWYATNAVAVAAGKNVTITLSNAAASAQIGATGIQFKSCTASPLDTVNATNWQGAVNTLAVSTGTLAQAAEVVVGGTVCFVNAVYSYSGSVGFTNINKESSNGLNDPGAAADYDTVASTSSVTWNPTWSNLCLYMGAITASFKQ